MKQSVVESMHANASLETHLEPHPHNLHRARRALRAIVPASLGAHQLMQIAQVRKMFGEELGVLAEGNQVLIRRGGATKIQDTKSQDAVILNARGDVAANRQQTRFPFSCLTRFHQSL